MDNGESSYRRFLAGDNEALSALIGAYKDGLMLYLNGYVGNIALAEELTEETFFRLITKKPRFSGKSAFKSWLYAIGRNVAVDHIRRSRRMETVPPEDLEKLLTWQESLEQDYIREERKLHLHKAMEKLPGDYYGILWLVYFEGFSNREAAAVLKKSDRQVINLLYRAKHALKAILEKEGFVYEDL